MSKTRYEVSYTAPVAATPTTVYRVIADYHDGHPRILPSAFRNMVVEKGGVGAGTQTRFEVHAFGQTQSIRHEVFEPEPGRVMTESDLHSPMKTTWTLTPDGAGCLVRIATDWTSAGGFQGFIERLFAPGVMRKVYRDELVRLDRYARQQAGA